MTIQVTCPQCKGTMEARQELLGKQAKCPFCSQVVKVERSAPAKDQPSATPEKKERNHSDRAPVGKPMEAPATAVQRMELDWPTEKNHAAPPQPNKSQQKPAAPARQQADEDQAPVGLVVAKAGHHRQRRSLIWQMLKSLFRQGNPTDVSVILTGLVAAGLTWLLFFAIVNRLPAENYVRDLLTNRGWVQYTTVYFTIWAAVVLVVKFWKIAKQRSSLTYDLLPVDRSTRITPSNADLVETHLRKLPLNPRKIFLINRLLMALDNFKARKSVPEVSAILNSQAETDGAMVDSSYSMLKVLIWAIPILGFIGTVVGISGAVDHFRGEVGAAGEIDGVKVALKGVTQGLAVAFDTTLLGLILSMVIMFPTNAVQKAEEDMLSALEQYCNEHLLPRLATDAEVRAEERGEHGDPQHTLEQWQRRLETLETALLEKVVEALGDIRKELAKKNQVQQEAAP